MLFRTESSRDAVAHRAAYLMGGAEDVEWRRYSDLLQPVYPLYRRLPEGRPGSRGRLSDAWIMLDGCVQEVTLCGSVQL